MSESYETWTSHPPTLPPENQVRLWRDRVDAAVLISLTDIQGFLPDLPDPVLWVRDEDGRASVLRAGRLEPNGSTVTLLTAHSEGGMFALHRVALDYLRLDPLFERWCTAVERSCGSTDRSWDEVDADLGHALIRLAIRRKLEPEQIAGVLSTHGLGVQISAKISEYASAREGETQEAKRTRRVATYFVQPVDGGLVKIGRTKDIEVRFSALQCGSPVKLKVLGAIRADIEKRLHAEYAARRSHGEWFNPDASLLTLIEAQAEDVKVVQAWCKGEDADTEVE